jgi:hypothetical protein
LEDNTGERDVGLNRIISLNVIDLQEGLMRIVIMLVAAALWLVGCQTRDGQGAEMNQKALQHSISVEQLHGTLDQLSAPSMSRDIMNQSEDQIVAWVRQVDEWTYKVLSAPITGEINRDGISGIRDRLMQVYSREMADRWINTTFSYDAGAGIYQVNNMDAILALGSEWNDYEVRVNQPSPDIYRIELVGSTKQDNMETRVNHTSTYQLQGDDTLIITDYGTAS